MLKRRLSSLVAAVLAAVTLQAIGADPAPVSPPPAAQLEWRGICSTPSGEIFSIYDVGQQVSRWVGLNELAPTFVVRQHRIHDGAEDIVVEVAGSRQTLSLKSGKIAAMVIAPLPGGASNPAAGPNASPAMREFSEIVDKMSADEKRRFSIFSHQVLGRLARDQQAAAGKAVAGKPAENPAETPESGTN